MKIGLFAVGRMKSGPERELIARYLDRAIATGRGLGLTGFTVHELTESRASSAPARKAEEAKALREGLAGYRRLVVLDEHGRNLTSADFAAYIEKLSSSGTESAAFVIGGADGLDAELIAAADLVLSFSALTWPHQIVRILLAEQLYRVTTILSGHPYHRQ